MVMKYKLLVALVGLLAASPILAEKYEYNDYERIRKETKASANSQVNVWLNAQRDGRYASKHIQNATPLEYEMTLKRWTESYTHPIPEYYEQDSGGSFKQ